MCQPVVLTNKNCFLVLVVIKNNEGYRELYCECYNSDFSLSNKFANSKFSHIATSSIGDTIEAKIWNDNSHIREFQNITRVEVVYE